MPNYDNASVLDMLRALGGAAGGVVPGHMGAVRSPEMEMIERLGPTYENAPNPLPPGMVGGFGGIEHMPPATNAWDQMQYRRSLQSLRQDQGYPQDIEEFMRQRGLAPPLYSRGFAGPGAP